MNHTQISDVTGENFPAFEAAMRSLASDLNDPYVISKQELKSVLFGENPAGFGAVLMDEDGALLGAALYSPVISTSKGGAGVYVSDLWVSKQTRGSGL